MKTFDVIYREALEQVMDVGVYQFNKRTKTTIKATHGYSFDWPMKYYPVTMARPMYVGTGAAEVAWMLMGTKSTKWLKKYTHIWDAFETDKDYLETAYGYRWRHAFGVDQIQNIISKLREDNTSRQQVLLSWDPRVDNVKEATNIPCPYTAVVNIIDNKLNIHLTLRSNDVYLGLPYDVLMYTLLGNILAETLEVEVGELFYSIAHMHLYENQFEAAKTIIARNHEGENRVIELRFTVNDVVEEPDHFVAMAKRDLKLTNYNPEAGPPKIKVVV
jgi:thymidylate synthase